ncbi:MAG TPA: histidine phosphatase family protein [Dehalococcoidia bacterium]|jgi:broad specificity phosphatase PhoE|nr:histidine phosphatase family protein [Dehalococcoidia bacterium]
MAINSGQPTEERQARPPGVFDQAFLTGVPDVTEVLLVRHGQQEIDVHGATVGDWIDPPLSEQGRLQARLLGEALSLKRIDAVFASKLRRASETAGEIARHHDLEVEYLDDLREVEVFRDVPPDKTALDFLGKELLEAVRERMLNERNWDVYPFSESSYDFTKRAVNAIETAIAKNAGERIAVVCHGGVINAYVGHIIGSRYDMFFRPAHTSVSIVVSGEGRRILRLLNDTHHLTTAEGDFASY